MTAPAPVQIAGLQDFQIRVLLVDDQAIVGEQVRRMLLPEKDIRYQFCQDPSKAIQQAVDYAPTVILQDLVMPDIEGMTLVKFYRNHPKLKQVPLIVLSSKEEPITKADAFANGANDYLVKLPDRLELVARIRYHSQGYINLLERNAAYDALLQSQQALATELAQAADYVMSLLPAPLKEGPVVTDWLFKPSEKLGGDSFGYHWIDERHMAIYLLDVCNHGVGPALLSVSVINVLRSQSLPRTDFCEPSQVMGILNENFQMEKHDNLYFTMWYGVYDRETRQLNYCSGGHPPALLFQPGVEVQELKTRNIMVGGMADIVYKSACATVAPGSTLYVYSDGVYEVSRPDNSMWTFEEFVAFLGNPPPGAGTAIQRLYEYVYAMHQQEYLEDDFSMLRIDLP